MNHDFMDDIVSFHMELDSIVKLAGWNKSPERSPDPDTREEKEEEEGGDIFSLKN